MSLKSYDPARYSDRKCYGLIYKALISHKVIANIRPEISTLEITGLPIYLDPN
ncbi:MAG: hypothetical protein ACXAC8_07220 [Candidatus Hodarchaeales archaeon]